MPMKTTRKVAARHRTTYLRDDLARDLRGLLPSLNLSADDARMVVDATMLRIAEVLTEGRMVRIAGLFGLWVVPAKKLATKTPQGEAWSGMRKPRMKATLYQEMLASLALKQEGGGEA